MWRTGPWWREGPAEAGGGGPPAAPARRGGVQSFVAALAGQCLPLRQPPAEGRGLGRGPAAQRGALVPEASAHFWAGSVGWTVSLVTVRREQDLDSEVVGELEPLVPLEVLEVGQGRRLRVRSSSGRHLEGWVSCWTRCGEQLVAAGVASGTGRVEDLLAAHFAVGGRHTVRSPVTVRSGEGLDSAEVGTLIWGEAVTILEMGQANRRRARVDAGSVEGWLSLATRQGQLLLNVRPGDGLLGPPPVRRMGPVGIVLSVGAGLTRRLASLGRGPTASDVLERNLLIASGAALRRGQNAGRELAAMLPEFGFSGARSQARYDEPTCRVCLSDFVDGELVKKLPCEHIFRGFHAGCLDAWLDRSCQCPMRCHIDVGRYLEETWLRGPALALPRGAAPADWPEEPPEAPGAAAVPAAAPTEPGSPALPGEPGPATPPGAEALLEETWPPHTMWSEASC
ncbi:unnamed protein product [Prorocentrum cordatum]|uniref:RING-type domain-containing protein n=1 Tax=Prorocentrum cordatum TaxID=2364126 RepID=A0ABN9UB74_9DINO|nr:unnamed protein product [Polarella glacialis]